MSSASQQLQVECPIGAPHTAIVDDPSDGDLSLESDYLQAVLQTEKLDVAEIDGIIALLDAGFQLRKEVLQLTMRIELLETKDKMLIESLGS